MPAAQTPEALETSDAGSGADRGTLALYAADASNYRQPPLAVLCPRTADEVIAAVADCRRRGLPILQRGAGTSLAGQATNEAVVFDLSRHFRRLLEIDPVRRLARVEPGCVLDELNVPAKALHGLAFGPDPATHGWCTIGGMIGNNACGPHSVMAGRTSDNVEELEILTYDGLRMRVGATSAEEIDAIVAAGGRRGEIYRALRELRDRYAGLVRERFPDIPRRVSGYNLDELLPENGFHVARALVGTEGTCVTVLEATLRLIEWPAARVLLVVSYENIVEAGDHVCEIVAAGCTACEGLDGQVVTEEMRLGMDPADAALLPVGGGWLLVEFGGATREEAAAKARELQEGLARLPTVLATRLYESDAEQAKIWEIRESGLGATARIGGLETWTGWEDSAVPPARLGGYLRDLQALLDAHGLATAFYGHFGQGCVHSRITFDMTSREGLDRFRRFVDEAADLCVAYGGSLSGEHGDGQALAELLPKMFGDEVCRAFREFKAIWDPDHRMNPGKVVEPYPILSNLRLGPDHAPWEPETAFRYPSDGGSLARAARRCVGVGKCRRAGGGTMCPSYMVTREEKHSTRGRAHLLHEMLTGGLPGGWRSEEVREALDLCLACKGCRTECPAGVDMATYKAEFLHHHYAGRRRPRAAYAMGLVHRWARLAARAPRLANLAGSAPGLSSLAKRLAGIAPERSLPAFASETFRSWFAGRPRPAARRSSGAGRGAPVLLWPDTFTNYFHPEIGRAAVAVLAAAGFEVSIPRAPLCCGRPLYDFGFLDRARAQLAEILDALAPDIAAGTPVVGLEPSCTAVFRDELPNLFPDDERARRLARQTVTLAELLADHAPGWQPPRLAGRALFHAHCHQKSILGATKDVALLRAAGLETDAPVTGCCGMAGAFGFEADKYEVSVAVGERVLLPAVRAAAPDTLVVTDGFSCREQIVQLTGRRPLHLAEVLRTGLEQEAEGTPAA